MHASCRRTAGTAVHVLFISRGAELQDTLSMAANVQLWSESPSRICFHVLAGDRALRELNAAPLALHAAKAGLSINGNGTFELDELRVHNASDAAWEHKLSAHALSWMHHPALQQHTKARAVTVAKLFLHELLPPTVTQVMVIDPQVYAMSDIVELWDWFGQQMALNPDAVLGYAPEGQNFYRMMYAGSMSENEAASYNSGVFLQRLDRIRSQPGYRALLPRMEALMRMKESARHPTFEVPMMHRLLDLGDQTALAVAASAERTLWKGLMVPLPCEWNWQSSVVWFAHAKWILPRRGAFKVPALLLNQHDSTCHEPPKLLLFNSVLGKRTHAKLELSTRGPAAHELNMAVLKKALTGKLHQSDCQAAAETLASVMERACNATFLLQRHTAFIEALWAVARKEELLIWRD